MAGSTNRGKFNLLGVYFRGDTVTTDFRLYLINSTPDADDNIYTDFTEASNYDGEQTINRNSTDFDVHTESDGDDTAYVQLKDIVFTASGGTCTATTAGLTDNNGTEASRELEFFWNLGATQNIPSGSTLTLQDLQITAGE